MQLMRFCREKHIKLIASLAEVLCDFYWCLILATFHLSAIAESYLHSISKWSRDVINKIRHMALLEAPYWVVLRYDRQWEPQRNLIFASFQSDFDIFPGSRQGGEATWSIACAGGDAMGIFRCFHGLVSYHLWGLFVWIHVEYLNQNLDKNYPFQGAKSIVDTSITIVKYWLIGDI